MTWTHINAWREVLIRVFDGFTIRHDVFPEWLVNPETNRRLKLDIHYPEIGVAVRFSGLQGKGRRQRPTLKEEEQQQGRDAARADLCEAHGISLVDIDVVTGEPQAIIRELSTALSNSSRRLAKSQRLQAEKAVLVEQVSQARSRLASIGRRLRHQADLKLYTELWQDRQYADIPAPESPATKGCSFTYTPGMAVYHASFGDGIVQDVQPEGEDDHLVSVQFADGNQKTFAASLVCDKLVPHQ